MQHNDTYRHYITKHNVLCEQKEKAEDWFVIKTAELLLHSPGIEVAARPWLYPLAEYGDTDLRPRLRRPGQITARQLPSIKASWTRKLTSRCITCEEDFALFSLLYDIALARQITGVVRVAQSMQIAPEEAASNMQNFDGFWEKEREKLEYMCRQQGSMPNIFFTSAPAEWKVTR